MKFQSNLPIFISNFSALNLIIGITLDLFENIACKYLHEAC